LESPQAGCTVVAQGLQRYAGRLERLLEAIDYYRTQLTAYAGLRGYELEEAPLEHGRRFLLSRRGEPTVHVNVYHTGNFVIPTGKPCPEDLERILLAAREALLPPPLPEMRWKVPPDARRELEKWLSSEYGRLRAKGSSPVSWTLKVRRGTDRCTLTMFRNGTLLFRGKGREHAQKLLDGLRERLGEATVVPRKKEESVTVEYPHIGTDEAGKGDYFGPLVIAGTLVDRREEEILRVLGVRDSKGLSDRQVAELAEAIRGALPGRFEVILITPRRYNELYAEFRKQRKNLNSLLAWGHGKVIENLLGRNAAVQAIADKFGDERYLLNALQTRGREISLVATPRAERFPSVAAASILARAAFVDYLRQKSEASGIKIPKGAGAPVIQAGRRIYERWGMRGLERIAKLHFRTTERITEIPVPPP
jgi:ribonuclease HIII